LDEGAPESLRAKPTQTRALNPIKNDKEAWRQALKDQAEYGTPSEKFAENAVTPQQADDIKVEECRNNAKQSGRPEGWIKNHFAYCHFGKYEAADLDCGLFGCETKGLFQARTTLIGYAYNGLRNVEFELILDRVYSSGTANAGAFTYRVECTGSPAGSCQPDGTEVTRTPQHWKADGEAKLFFNSPAVDPSPIAGEQKAFGTLKVKFAYRFPQGITRANGPETGVRFDSAWYLNRKEGSIFNLANPWIGYSVRDEAVRYSAWNIYNAQKFPNSTQPYLEGEKKLPGASAADPLHRLYHDKKRRQANRSEAVRYCHQTWAGYSDLGQDCDEYPFACTYEGAAGYKFADRPGRPDIYRQNNYAVNTIPSYDNQESGRRLGTWYSADRILDRDAFHVRISGVTDIEPPLPPPGPPGSNDAVDCGDGLV